MTRDARSPMVVKLSEIRSQPVRWLWPGFVPLGKLTILCGDPGLGKSFLTLDMASRASRGGPWPGDAGVNAPLSTMLLSAEDDPVDTIRPRLEAMGADLSRIVLLAGMRTGEGLVDEFDLSRDALALADAIAARPGTSLVVIDPVSAFVGATDSYNNAQVRAMLKPLSDLAADTGAAIVLVTHLRKNEQGAVVHRAMGSLAFTAAARQVLVVARCRANPDARTLAVAKSNLGRDRLAVPYRIDDGRVRFDEPIQVDAEELLEAPAPRPASRPPSPAGERFARELRSVIALSGPIDQDHARQLAESLGANWNNVRHAQWRDAHGFVVADRDQRRVWDVAP